MVGLGATDAALWGLCQGSGSKPYQTAIDLTEPAFKCSCPSRKFPCKHALGLMLLFAQDAGRLSEPAPPEWAQTLARQPRPAGREGERGRRHPGIRRRPPRPPRGRRAKREQRVSDGHR